MTSACAGQRRVRRKCAAPLALLGAALIAGLFSATAQQNNDPLSSGQADQVRELGDRPNERIKLYLKFVNQRAQAIRDLTPDSTEDSRAMDLRSRYEEFTRLTDELAENVDTYDADHADIRKALKQVVADSAKWPAILSAPAADGAYDFARTTALDSAKSLTEDAQKLLPREEAYFAAHKNEAGKNGKAPSPEP